MENLISKQQTDIYLMLIELENAAITGHRYGIKNIRRFHECEVGIENICPKDHRLASCGLQGDDR